MQYEPMPRQAHLDRGTCCYKSRGEHSRCVFCPYKPETIHRPLDINPAIEAALRSGETTTIYSDRVSLIPIVVLQDRVTIVYKPYLK